MRKFIAVLLAVLTAVPAIAFPAFAEAVPPNTDDAPAGVKYVVTPEKPRLIKSSAEQTVTYTVRSELGAGVEQRTVTLYIKPPQGMKFSEPKVAEGMQYDAATAPGGIFEQAKMEMGQGPYNGQVVLIFSCTTRDRCLKESAALGTFKATIEANKTGELKPEFGDHYYGYSMLSGNNSDAFEADTEAEALNILLNMPGDVNGDGKANATDCQKICEHMKGIKTLSGSELSSADVNGDGKANATDCQKICEHMKGIKSLV